MASEVIIRLQISCSVLPNTLLSWYTYFLWGSDHSRATLHATLQHCKHCNICNSVTLQHLQQCNSATLQHLQQCNSATFATVQLCNICNSATLQHCTVSGFVAIPVFFSDRYSTLQSGSSTQDHRLMKNEIWTTFWKLKNKAAVWFWKWYNLANIQFQSPM